MLEAYLSAVFQEGLEVLVVVVEAVLVSNEHVGDVGIAFLLTLHLFHVVETTESSGHVAGIERIAFVGGHDADHVDGLAVRVLFRFDHL